MKRLAPLALVSAGIAIGYAASGVLPASSRAADAPANPERVRTACAWAAEIDAVKAAPANHKILLENERVRVLEVTVQPGEREAVHAHCNPSAMYIMQAGPYRDYDAEGKILSDVSDAPPSSVYPVAVWRQPEPPHSVENLDNKPLRLLRVELKD